MYCIKLVCYVLYFTFYTFQGTLNADVFGADAGKPPCPALHPSSLQCSITGQSGAESVRLSKGPHFPFVKVELGFCYGIFEATQLSGYA